MNQVSTIEGTHEKYVKANIETTQNETNNNKNQNKSKINVTQKFHPGLNTTKCFCFLFGEIKSYTNTENRLRGND